MREGRWGEGGVVGRGGGSAWAGVSLRVGDAPQGGWMLAGWTLAQDD